MPEEKQDAVNPDSGKKANVETGTGGNVISAKDDPVFAKFHALLVQEEDKKVLENSLLISLVFFIVLTFVVFPDVILQALEAEQEIEELDIPQITIIEKQEEEPPPEVETVERERERTFEPMPDIKSPTGEETIIAVQTREKLDVEQENVDDFMFGMPSGTPGPIEVAGNVIKPEVTFPSTQPFPQKAKILRRNGAVKVRLIIRKNGDFEILRVISENPPDFGFAEAAMEYLQGSRWKPATQNGRPIDVYYEITIEFKLTS